MGIKGKTTAATTGRVEPANRYRLEELVGTTWTARSFSTSIDTAETTAQTNSRNTGRPWRIIPLKADGSDGAELAVYSRGNG